MKQILCKMKNISPLALLLVTIGSYFIINNYLHNILPSEEANNFSLSVLLPIYFIVLVTMFIIFYVDKENDCTSFYVIMFINILMLIDLISGREGLSYFERYFSTIFIQVISPVLIGAILMCGVCRTFIKERVEE